MVGVTVLIPTSSILSLSHAMFADEQEEICGVLRFCWSMVTGPRSRELGGLLFPVSQQPFIPVPAEHVKVLASGLVCGNLQDTSPLPHVDFMVGL